MATEPKILQVGIFAIQVCVPSEWTDQQISDWAREEYISFMASEFEKTQTGPAVIADLLDDIRIRYSFAIAQEGDEIFNNPHFQSCVQCSERSDMVHRVIHL